MKTPQQTVNEFFARADVKALQEIQKRNHYGSTAHRNAFIELLKLAKAIGAEGHFESIEDYDDSLMHMLAKRFNCTPAQVAALYRKNAVELLQMAEDAKRTGGKVNGFTEQQLREKAAEFSTRGAAVSDGKN